tara:strand:+ start:168 stop:596 length:429 start_codon:yes stop_codon:yes gene_type:complete
MNNFDLKKFLTENKLTTASKLAEGEKVDLTKPLPALDKPLKDIGMEINKKLEGMGYSTQTVSDPTQHGDALENGGDKKLAVLAYQAFQGGKATLEIRVHKNNADDLKKIIDSYSFDSKNGGYQGSFVSSNLVRASISASEQK